MNRWGLCFALAGLTLVAAGVLAQAASESFAIPRQAVSAGSQSASSTSFRVVTTLGIPEEGAAMTSASFSLRGGFPGADDNQSRPDPVFVNGFEGGKGVRLL